MAEAKTLTEEDKANIVGALLNSEQDRDLQVDRLVAFEGCKPGENFMTVVTKIEVTGHNKATNRPYRRLLMMKQLPNNESHRQELRCEPSFSNEITFYTQVLPTLRIFCGDQYLSSFPVCLKASNNMILFRHLGEDGYVMADNKIGLDFNHCALVLKALGRFHGISLSMKHCQATVFNKTRKLLEEVSIVSDTLFETSVELTLKLALLCLSHPGEDNTEFENSIAKLKNIQGNTIPLLKSIARPKESLAVICHGDLWNNNMIFRYRETENSSRRTVNDVCFIDLQASRYASPAMDILYFLYSSSQPGITRDHFDQLIGIYHSGLTETMQDLAAAALPVSVDDIQKEIKKHAVYGLLMAFLLIPAVTADEAWVQKVNVNNMSKEWFESEGFLDDVSPLIFTTNFRQRIRDTVAEFQTRGLF